MSDGAPARRIAASDVGTNTARALLAHVDAAGRLERIWTDPPTGEDLARASRIVERVLPDDLPRVPAALAVGGTATSPARLAGGSRDGVILAALDDPRADGA